MILSDGQKFHLMGKIYSHGVKILFSWGKNLIYGVKISITRRSR
jgi:hypothetical protein